MGSRPWLELSHPQRTGLDDLELHVLLIPVAVCPADNIPGLKIA